MFREAYILGNGPSLYQLFDRSRVLNTDLLVGCNFSDSTLGVRYTIISDLKPIRAVLSGKSSIDMPAVLTDRAYNCLIKQTDTPDKYIDIHDTMDYIGNSWSTSKVGFNSAQHAASYVCGSEVNIGRVHLLGIDSFWMLDIRSSTDAHLMPERYGKTRRKPNIVSTWRSNWAKLFSDYPSVEFMVHVPKGCVDKTMASLDIYSGHNVSIHEHSENESA